MADPSVRTKTMIPFLASMLLISNQARFHVTGLHFPRRIFAIRPVGGANSHFVVVQQLGPTVTDTGKPGTNFFLVDAMTGKKTPLPEGSTLAGTSSSTTVDLVMNQREVWRIPISHPDSKTVIKTRRVIESICFAGDSAEACYMTTPSNSAKSQLMHVLPSGVEQRVPLSSHGQDYDDRTPLQIVYCLPGRCLVAFDDGTDEEGAQKYHMAWVSTITGKPIGQPSNSASGMAGTLLSLDCLPSGLLVEFILPKLDHHSIGGPKFQVYRVLDLVQRKVVDKVSVPYSEGVNATMGISYGGVTNQCVFCIEDALETHASDKNGRVTLEPHLLRSYYGYRLGSNQAVKLYHDTIGDFYATSGNDWTPICALTNDSRYLVAVGSTFNQVETVSLNRW